MLEVWKSLVLGPNVSSQICNKLLPTWSSLSTSATVTTSTSFELASSHARVTSIKFTKRYGCSKSEKKFSFRTKRQLPNLLQTVANMILTINISNSNNLDKFWVDIVTRQGHTNQVYQTLRSQWVSELGSYWQAFPLIGLGSDKKWPKWYRNLDLRHMCAPCAPSNHTLKT